MKKKFSSLLCYCIFVMVFVVCQDSLYHVGTAFGSVGDTPNITISSASGSSGDKVTVNISFANVSGKSISELSVWVEFDPDILENPTVVIGAAASAAQKEIISEWFDNNLWINLYSYENYNAIGNGIVASITFDIKSNLSDGTSTQLIPEAYGYDSDYNDIVIAGTGGTITIAGGGTSTEGIDPPYGVSFIDATSTPNNSRIYMGNIVTVSNKATLSSQMELSVDFPAYNRPVDIWVIVALPDGRFYMVDESGNVRSVEDGIFPVAAGLSGTKIKKQIIAPFSPGAAGAPFEPWPASGLWWVCWLISPGSNNDLITAVDSGNYELGFYSFNVNSENQNPTDQLNITDYFPKSGPAGSYILLKLEKMISELGENIQVLYNQQTLDADKVSKNSEDILQITIPEDAVSGSIQVRSDKYTSNTVQFSVQSSVLTPLISQSVSPASTEQSVSYNDEISVTIPSGILDKTRTLSISKVENSPPNSIAPFSSSFAYDVTIEGLEQLDDYIEIKIKYNPDLLSNEYPVEDQLIPMRYDDVAKSWIPLPYHVDLNSQTLSIYTDHLCILETVIITSLVIGNVAGWSGVAQECINDIYITPEGNFRLLYSKAAITADATLEDNAWSTIICPSPIVTISSYSPDHPKFIQDMGNFLETSLKSYVDTYKFKDPITKPGWLWGTSKDPITVKIDSWWVAVGGDPNYEKIWEIIHFPTDVLKDYSGFTSYGTIAHELFHRMEAEYYGIVGFKTPANLWWLEAAAEYAGFRAAWSNKSDVLHGKTGFDFLSYPISKTGKMENKNGWNLDQSYEYAAAAFIQFLVEKKGLDFKGMMEHVAGGSPLHTPLEMLNGYNSLIPSQCYRDFAAWGIFGDDSFLKKYKISEIAEANDSMTINENSTLEISFTGGNFSSINIYRFDQEYDRTSNVPVADRNIMKGEVHEVTVNKGDVLYLLATNPGKEDETLYVSVREMLNGEQKQELPHVFELKGGYSGKLWTVKVAEDSSSGWHLITAKEAAYSTYIPNPNFYGNTFKITSSQDSSFISWIYPDEQMQVSDRLTYNFDAKSTPGKVETLIKWTDTIYPDSGKQNVAMTLSMVREWLPASFPQTLKPGQSIEITESVSAKIEPDPKTLGDSLSFTPKVLGLMETLVNGERLISGEADSYTYTNVNIENSSDSLLSRKIAWVVPDGVSGEQMVISFVAKDSGSAGLGYSYGSYMDNFQSAGITLIYTFR